MASVSVTGLPDNDMDYDTVCGNGPYPDLCPHGIDRDYADCGQCHQDDIDHANQELLTFFRQKLDQIAGAK